MIIPGPLLGRLEQRTSRSENGCLIWTGVITTNGYGTFQLSRSRFGLAHRLMWEQKVGPIPEGLELDHLCRERSCVEISHLEVVTHRENDMRGQAPAILRHHSGICVRGHEFKPGGQCRTCTNEAQRLGYQYLRSQGYTPDQARKQKNHSWVRRAVGFTDLRGAS